MFGKEVVCGLCTLLALIGIVVALYSEYDMREGVSRRIPGTRWFNYSSDKKNILASATLECSGIDPDLP